MASSGCCCCGDEPPSVIDTYAAVTQDKQIKAKLDAVKKYALGEHNQVRPGVNSPKDTSPSGCALIAAK